MEEAIHRIHVSQRVNYHSAHLVAYNDTDARNVPIETIA